MRLAVVSPFLDRRHGTELCIVEQVERLASKYGWEIHIYSQRVEDVRGLRDAECSSIGPWRISWHKVSDIPGPHLVKFLWWMFANRRQRHRDRRAGRCRPDVTYSPGINCFDADAIVVHIVFSEFYARVRNELRLRSIPLRSWPLAIHRRLYYRLIMSLEQRIYGNPDVHLAAVSELVADQLRKFFHRDDVVLIPNAVDTSRFDFATRVSRREACRRKFALAENQFVLLLIGNDWKKKGLEHLLRAIELNLDLPLQLLVVGRDQPALYATRLEQSKLQDRVKFLSPVSDVMQFYAAADAYVGPSLEDAFGLPVIEAMACGLPVVASVRAGVSAIVEDRVNGLLLRNLEQPEELATMLRLLAQDGALRERLGMAAAQTAARFTWDHNAKLTADFLQSAAGTNQL